MIIRSCENIIHHNKVRTILWWLASSHHCNPATINGSLFHCFNNNNMHWHPSSKKSINQYHQNLSTSALLLAWSVCSHKSLHGTWYLKSLEKFSSIQAIMSHRRSVKLTFALSQCFWFIIPPHHHDHRRVICWTRQRVSAALKAPYAPSLPKWHSQWVQILIKKTTSAKSLSAANGVYHFTVTGLESNL